MRTEPSRLAYHRRSVADALLTMLLLISGIWIQPVTAGTSAASCRGRLSLGTGKKVVYYRTAALESTNPRAEVAVIVIHGLSRNADDYFERVVAAAEISGELGKTMVFAPFFQKQEDNPKSDEHYWTGGWSRGDLSQDSKRVSSFAVIDHIVSKLSNRKRFPKLKRIILAGHSAGGQFTNRYAAAGRSSTPEGTQMRFLIMNPSSYLYLEDNIEYKYGLRDLNRYSDETGANGCRENMVSRRAYYLGGKEDTGSANLDVCDAANAQGKHRFERFQHYRDYVRKYPDPRWRKNATFHEVPGIGHDGSKMFASDQARQAMFQ